MKELEVKLPTVTEIQEQLNTTIAAQTANESKLDELRQERAHLVCECGVNNDVKIDSLDRQIVAIRDTLDNTPAVILELKKILTSRQRRDAEKEREILINKQLEAVDEVCVLSRSFVGILKKAFEVNSQLQQALAGYHGLQQKTGQVILSEAHCSGSADYLRVLKETMEMQLSGVHTSPCGAGIIGAGVELRI